MSIVIYTEVALHRYSSKLVFWKISQISQENTCLGVRPAALLKRDSNTIVFLWNLRNFQEHLFLQDISAGCSCSCLQFLICAYLLILIYTYLFILKFSLYSYVNLIKLIKYGINMGNIVTTTNVLDWIAFLVLEEATGGVL